jgi:hypothetical protein
MKKLFFTTALLTTVIAGFSACAPKNEPNASNATTAPTPTPTPAPATATQPSTGGTAIAGLKIQATLGDTFYSAAVNPISIEYANPNNLVFELNKGAAFLPTDSTSKPNEKGIVTAVKEKEVILTVSDTSLKTSQVFKFAVKELPTMSENLEAAYLMVENLKAGEVAAKEFAAAKMLNIKFEGVPHTIYCEVDRYSYWYQTKKQDPIVMSGLTSKIDVSSQVKKATTLAKKGDTYTFKDVFIKCPGMLMGKKISEAVFKIK